MQRVDLSPSTRIPFQMEFLSGVSRMRNPQELLDLFLQALRRVGGTHWYLILCTRGMPAGHFTIGVAMDEQGREVVRASDPWNGGNGLDVHRDGVLSLVISDARPTVLHDLQLSIDPVLQRWAPAGRSLMAVPIFVQGEPGNWLVIIDREPDAFALTYVEEMITRANLAGALVTNVTTTQRLDAAHRRIDQEIERIAAIQRAILPRSLPQVDGIQLAVSHDNYEQAGGDLYDARLLERNGRRICALLVADAAGHGPSATVVAAMLHTVAALGCESGAAPAAVMRQANHALCARPIGSSFVTAALVYFDLGSRDLTYCIAGHPPPLLRRGPLSIRLEDNAGIPLGIASDAEYVEASHQLHRGDVLVLYTDGVCEATNAAGEAFGYHALDGILTDCDGDVECVVKRVQQAVREHEGGEVPNDDRTILVMQVR
jgi:sigma-B regulation protein RsbU (phosphoserine phosphatase)